MGFRIVAKSVDKEDERSGAYAKSKVGPLPYTEGAVKYEYTRFDAFHWCDPN